MFIASLLMLTPIITFHPGVEFFDEAGDAWSVRLYYDDVHDYEQEELVPCFLGPVEPTPQALTSAFEF